jgi:hypothetical protein
MIKKKTIGNKNTRHATMIILVFALNTAKPFLIAKKISVFIAIL